eukprot:IDg1864t1
MLEAICDVTLSIWNAVLGMAGSYNDINVLEASTLSNKIANGSCPLPMSYTIAERHEPDDARERLMAKNQEAHRKDIERAFGALQSRCHILAIPSRFWNRSSMAVFMRACIIMHNMIVEQRMVGIEEDWVENEETVVGKEPQFMG